MILKPETRKTVVNERMRGGDGSVVIEHLLDAEHLIGAGRLYAKITLAPGCSIGRHVHEGEAEAFYVLKGNAAYDDDGAATELAPGDVAYTADGGGHAIANNGAGDVELLALIVYNRRE
jgi:quercetin dioxygenase-like cupin family protein